MYSPQTLVLQAKKQKSDGIGGFTETWDDLRAVSGYLDLLQGTDENTIQQAFIEQSTHVAVLPKYEPGITDAMRIVDETGRFYEITYVDDPVGVHHHTELYLKYGGNADGQVQI